MNKLLVFFLMFIFNYSTAQEITGDWYGTLNVQGQQLDLVFHISHAEEGYKATMDSPKQKAFGLPIPSVTFADKLLHLKAPNHGIQYEGILEGKTISGMFKQGGMELPLDLVREKPEADSGRTKRNRPQEPKRPFPYVEEEVSFDNSEDSVTLAGTFTYPKNGDNFPAVILISGSGPQDRNEEVYGHKPFLVLSDYLTRHGIAVLRYDDRGVGESTGNFGTSTTTDFATDARAAVEFLRNRKEINSEEIGIIGHSEGGMIAPMLADEDKDIAYLVLLAAPGVRGDKMMLSQKELYERKIGVPEPAVQQNQEVFSGVYDIIVESQSGKQLDKVVFDYFKKHYGSALQEEEIAQLSKQLTGVWMVGLLKNDPAVALAKVKIPVLAINGKNDVQVISSINLPAIENSLKKAGNKNVTIKEYDNLNHLFQESKTGLPNEYSEIEQTFSPEVLEDIKSWILEVTGN